MTKIEELEAKLEELNLVVICLDKLTAKYNNKRHQVWMALNRARRLEREAHNIKIKRVPDLKGL